MGRILRLHATAGCGDNGNKQSGMPPATCTNQPEQVAYIVARDSDDLTKIDLSCMQVTLSAKIETSAAHMGELNADATKLYVDSEDTDETVVVKTSDFSVVKRITTPTHPTHITHWRNEDKFSVVAEGADSIFFVDAVSDEVIKVLPGLLPAALQPHGARRALFVRRQLEEQPHHARRSADAGRSTGRSRSMATTRRPTPSCSPTRTASPTCRSTRSRASLYAAHRATGKVMVYDTNKQEKVTELQVGQRPWIVYAEHPFGTLARRHMVPNFADESASVINSQSPAVLGTLAVADQESFGVNYSPLAPGEAFLMNREKQQIAVIDLGAMKAVDQIDVGGTTETASTSADGKYIVASVSSANSVVVIDAATHAIVKTFENVGKYPWSVTMFKGQNYCH